MDTDKLQSANVPSCALISKNHHPATVVPVFQWSSPLNQEVESAVRESRFSGKHPSKNVSTTDVLQNYEGKKGHDWSTMQGCTIVVKRTKRKNKPPPCPRCMVMTYTKMHLAQKAFSLSTKQKENSSSIKTPVMRVAVSMGTSLNRVLQDMSIALHAEHASATDGLLHCCGQRIVFPEVLRKGMWGWGCAVAVVMTAVFLKASYEMTEAFLL